MKRWGWWRMFNYYMAMSSSSLRFLVVSGIVLVTMSSVYAWLFFSPDVHKGLSSNGCQVDNEGSWSIGVFYGDSPFALKPIESVSSFDSLLLYITYVMYVGIFVCAIWFLLIYEFEVVSILRIVLGFLVFDAEMSCVAWIWLFMFC